MSTMRIELVKTVNNNSSGSGYVAVYCAFPHAVSITEARAFSLALNEVLEVADRWRDGELFAGPLTEAALNASEKTVRRGRPRKARNNEELEIVRTAEAK